MDLMLNNHLGTENNMNKKLCEFCQRKPARIRFCSNKCKDRYHNRRNPRGYFRHLSEISYCDYEEDDSWDSHKIF